MRMSSWTPSIVADDDDQNVYIVLDDFGRQGRSYRETDVESMAAADNAAVSGPHDSEPPLG